MIKHILFDFDGTLVNTNELIIGTMEQTVRHVLGKEMSQQDFHAILGKHLEDQMTYFSKEKSEEMIHYYKQYYRSHQDEMVKQFPHINTLLEKLKKMDCKIAITSAKGRNGILHGLELLDLKQYIDYIVSAYDVENGKPHPESIHKCIEYFRCNREDMIIIGDSPYDILCGINAGIKTGLVAWTILPETNFKGIKPDYIIETPLDIIKIVQGHV